MNATPDPIRLAGTLSAYAETGTEGVLWAITVAGLPGYSGLHVLKAGDRLRIYGKEGTIAWEGVVNFEWTRRKRPSPFNPAYEQQEIHGMWVHGFHPDLTPEAWADAFFQEAPAVAFTTDTPALVAEDAAILDAWGVDPLGGWARWGHHAERAAALRKALPGALRWIAAEMGWPAPASVTPESLPLDLLRLLAVDRARRVLWVPEHASNARWAPLKAMWPTPPDEATLRQWAQRHLPADHVPI